MSKRSGGVSDAQQSDPRIDGALRTRLFKALGDPSRIGLLVRLAKACEPQTVSQVAECCPCDLSVVSRHLAMLRDAGILYAEKRGKNVYYSVRFKEVVATLREIADALEACCVTDEFPPTGCEKNRKEER